MPPAIRVFLSCTRGDLDQDCRPAVIREIKLKAEAVDMDAWVNDFTDQAVEVCHRKLKDESSHYVGIFAYRRGWVPDCLREHGTSITQAEFEWARQYRKTMAVWIPDPASPFAAELRQRAVQSAEEEEAQKRFLQSLDAGMRNLFPDPVYLSNRVNDKVALWRGGGLMQMASVGGAVAVASGARPRPADLRTLLERKHAAHRQAFAETLEGLVLPRAPRTLGWVVHGDGDLGQEELANALIDDIENETAPPHKRVTVQVGVSWRARDVPTLIAAISSDFASGAAITTLEELSAAVRRSLEHTNVVLKIKHVHRLHGSFGALVEQFWRPLVAGLGNGLPRRLFALATSEEAVGECWEALVRAPGDGETRPPAGDLARVVRPPPLTPLRAAEVARWMGRWIVDADEAYQIAESLVRESRGYPNELFRCVDDDAFWAELERAP